MTGSPLARTKKRGSGSVASRLVEKCHEDELCAKAQQPLGKKRPGYGRRECEAESSALCSNCGSWRHALIAELDAVHDTRLEQLFVSVTLPSRPGCPLAAVRALAQQK